MQIKGLDERIQIHIIGCNDIHGDLAIAEILVDVAVFINCKGGSQAGMGVNGRTDRLCQPINVDRAAESDFYR